MRVTVPWGIFGYGNIGDEAMLKGFRRLVDEYPSKLDLQIAAQDPRHAASTEPRFSYHQQNGISFRRWLASWRCQAQLIVGDTPVSDRLGGWPLQELDRLAKAAAQRRKPLAFLGIGAESLEHRSSQEIVRRQLAPQVVHWSVRSDRDKQRLREYGVDPGRVNVAADLAWLLMPASGECPRMALAGIEPGGPIVGVNLMGEIHTLREVPDLSKKVAQVLDVLIEKQEARIAFFCNDVREAAGFDKAANESVRSQMRHGERTHSIDNRYWTPEQMMSMIRECSCTISMRYHFCLFSALQGVPFLAIKRSDKVDDLCCELDWKFGLSPKEFARDSASELLAEMAAGRGKLAETLVLRAAGMHERAKRNREAFDALVRERS